MGVLIRKYRSGYLFTGIAKLSIVLFLVSLSSSFIDTIWAVYLAGFFQSESYVGLFSGFLSVLAFLSFFFLVPLIEKSKKSVLFATVLILSALTYIFFAINKNFYIFIFLAIVITIFISIKITTFGIIVKDKSRKENLSRNEGIVYSFNNFSWLIGPLIVSLFLLDFGHSIIFVSSATLLVFAFFMFKMSGIKDDNVVKKVDNDVFKNFLEFFKNKERVISYLIGAGVTTWWALIYLYIPLYIIDNGLNEYLIGIFLFACAGPLILFEYLFSKMAGKYGAKKFFLIGYAIITIIPIIVFFVNSPYLVLGILALGSVGLAMLEPTTEAYFFDIIKNKKEENKFYGPYNTAIETGLIFGKIAPAILLIFLPFKYIFLLFSAFMFFFFIVSLKAKKVVERRD
ncbi:MFS transporter [Candidatus Pacearchaeota archaeon]|nr:MFS transporter [Candidatus Pacearchaeota archaeon]